MFSDPGSTRKPISIEERRGIILTGAHKAFEGDARVRLQDGDLPLRCPRASAAWPCQAAGAASGAVGTCREAGKCPAPRGLDGDPDASTTGRFRGPEREAASPATDTGCPGEDVSPGSA